MLKRFILNIVMFFIRAYIAISRPMMTSVLSRKDLLVLLLVDALIVGGIVYLVVSG